MKREKFGSSIPAIRQQIAALLSKGRVSGIDANDIAGLHRYAKCHIANSYWDMCSATARVAMLQDAHHFVRSCALIAKAA